MSNELTKATWLEVTPTGAVAKWAPTFAEYESEVSLWVMVHAACPMVLGDLLNIGEMLFPEIWAQVVDAWTERYAAQTLYNYKSVMARVPHEVRQEGLRYCHCEAVASLSPNMQKQVLAIAARDQLGKEETRDLVHRIKLGNGQPVPPRKYTARCKRAFQEVRDKTTAIVLEEPYWETSHGELPDGEVDVTLKEVI